jgi:hypothetical protein
MYAVQIALPNDYWNKETVYEGDAEDVKEYAQSLLRKSSPYTLVSVYNYDTGLTVKNWFQLKG